MGKNKIKKNDVAVEDEKNEEQLLLKQRFDHESSSDVEFLSDFEVVEAPREVVTVPTYAELVSANPTFQAPTGFLQPVTASRRNACYARRENKKKKSVYTTG